MLYFLFLFYAPTVARNKNRPINHINININSERRESSGSGSCQNEYLIRLFKN